PLVVGALVVVGTALVLLGRERPPAPRPPAEATAAVVTSASEVASVDTEPPLPVDPTGEKPGKKELALYAEARRAVEKKDRKAALAAWSGLGELALERKQPKLAAKAFEGGLAAAKTGDAKLYALAQLGYTEIQTGN